MSFPSLMKVAGPPIGSVKDAIRFCAEGLTKWGDRGTELAELLGLRNGFYAFESALLVRGIGNLKFPRSLETWNSEEVWISQFNEFGIKPMLFFAEDIFGNQFAISGEKIVFFDPETGKAENLADSLEEWTNLLLSDRDYYTGFPVASEWNKINGLIGPGMRLVPKIPFICGGRFALENLVSLEEAEAMKFRGELAKQIKDLPDGSRINFKIL